MRRLKIALVVHDLHDYGGHSLYTRILANELSQHHEVAIFANRGARSANARWQFQHVRAARASALLTVRSFPLGLRFYERELRQYDIRHTQGYCGGQPNVVTAHICVEAYLKSLRCSNKRTRLTLKLMAAAERDFYRRHQGQVIAVSHKVARELREFYGVNVPITVITHGVDPIRFNLTNRERYRAAVRRQWNVAEGEVVALYVGDLTKAQVHLKALSAAAPELRLVVVTASRAYRWTSPNLQILPITSELQRYYAAADAFVFPTMYDAFGMVVLEAMASGLPVFTSDCAGAAELVQSGKDGFVFTLDDWVAATIAGLRNLASLRSVGEAAANTVRHHGWSNVVREVERVYFNVAGRGVLAAEAPVEAYGYQR
jgi:UDP-glucose:(heptosyl)LPS alpha-1,3-glucosyltransferase